MKRLILLVLFVLMAAIFGCDDDAENPANSSSFVPDPNDVEVPTVAVTSHTDSMEVARGAITIRANATDDTGIRFVRFMVDNQNIGEDTESPYEMTWDASQQAPLTHHEICAWAFDNGGRSAFDCVTIKITQ